MENTNNIQGRCATCVNWKRSVIIDFVMGDKPANVGTCEMVFEDIKYHNCEDTANEIIRDGYMDGCNVFTHENFGCIHYEPKQD